MNERELSRFEAKFSVDASGCWLWNGAKNNDGYGRFHAEGGRRAKMWMAHRIAYTHWVGDIADNLQLDHLCRNPSCVNPKHLEPVTLIQNVQRGKLGVLKTPTTHCANGHAYDDENSYYSTQDRWQRRQCRTCKREWMRRKRHNAA